MRLVLVLLFGIGIGAGAMAVFNKWSGPASPGTSNIPPKSEKREFNGQEYYIALLLAGEQNDF